MVVSNNKKLAIVPGQDKVIITWDCGNHTGSASIKVDRQAYFIPLLFGCLMGVQAR